MAYTVVFTPEAETQLVDLYVYIAAEALPDRARLLLELRDYCGDNLPADFPREPIVGL